MILPIHYGEQLIIKDLVVLFDMLVDDAVIDPCPAAVGPMLQALYMAAPFRQEAGVEADDWLWKGLDNVLGDHSLEFKWQT